jgi:hypothetical protein
MADRMTAAQLQAFYKADGDHSAPRQDREGPIHKAILQLLDLCLPGDAIYHHSPNELDMAGPEAARQIAKARKLGTKAGWTDIEIVWQGRFYGIEVKAPGGRLSQAQADIHAAMRRAGAEVAIVSSVTEMREVLNQWGLHCRRPSRSLELPLS